MAWSVVGVGAGALIGQAVGDEAKWSDDEAVWLGALTGATSGVAVGFWFGLPLTYQFGGP